MICPLCDCADWRSIEKNKDGVNLRVQCTNCGWVHGTHFRSERFEYRQANGCVYGQLINPGDRVIEIKASVEIKASPDTHPGPGQFEAREFSLVGYLLIRK
jgi:hypothetical protein